MSPKPDIFSVNVMLATAAHCASASRTAAFCSPDMARKPARSSALAS
ncbi:hypothetical protein [Rugamonas sp. DEMB1]|nr:hypothetical protein [Rugamonas sp. DEMB1]WGG52958.1 hypothetical protein QC826_12995 [Rugamonas sp. DEMB1]